MFGNQKLEITFGPWQDIVLLIAVFLVIFVYGGAAANMVINEVKSWFGKSDEDPKSDPNPIRYEVMWTTHLDDFYDTQLRISSSVEDATAALVKENGAGFVRYRPFLPDQDYDWGMALWRDEPKLELPVYDNALRGLREYAEKDVEATNELFKPQPSNLTLKDFEQDEESDDKPMWVIQWSNNADFSNKMGGELHTFLTKFLSVKIREVMKEHGDGYIRYRASDAADNDSTWVPNGYVTKEEVTNAKHL